MRDHSHLPEVGSRGLLERLGCVVGATGGGGSLCSRAGAGRDAWAEGRVGPGAERWSTGRGRGWSDGALGGAGSGVMGCLGGGAMGHVQDLGTWSHGVLGRAGAE